MILEEMGILLNGETISKIEILRKNRVDIINDLETGKAIRVYKSHSRRIRVRECLFFKEIIYMIKMIDGVVYYSDAYGLKILSVVKFEEILSKLSLWAYEDLLKENEARKKQSKCLKNL